MAHSTKNSSTSDEILLPSQLEHEVIGMETVMSDLFTRLNNTKTQVEQLSSQFTQFATQFSGIPAAIQQLSDKMDRNQSAPSPPPVTQSPPPRVERTIPINNSTPYQHPHARSADAARPPPSFQDHPRKDEEWCIGENSGGWFFLVLNSPNLMVLIY
jgi:hypothetical protein